MNNIKTCENNKCSVLHNGLFGSGRFCCRACSNIFSRSKVAPGAISAGMQKAPIRHGNCHYCKKLFVKRNPKTKYCCRSCSSLGTAPIKLQSSREGGKKSAASQSQNRRSKNEIAFANLCADYFLNLEFNAPIFNGWDADIIIHDIKTAVLWNGKWHYEKIGNHNLAQVQARDKIKQLEIEKSEYNVYIIKDLGRYNLKFVESEFDKFIHYINTAG